MAPNEEQTEQPAQDPVANNENPQQHGDVGTSEEQEPVSQREAGRLETILINAGSRQRPSSIRSILQRVVAALHRSEAG